MTLPAVNSFPELLLEAKFIKFEQAQNLNQLLTRRCFVLFFQCFFSTINPCGIWQSHLETSAPQPGLDPTGQLKAAPYSASLLSDTRCFSLPETCPSPLFVSLRSAVLLLLWLDKCSACILLYLIHVSVVSSLTPYWCWFPRQRSSPQPFSPCPCKVTASRDVSTQLSSILFLATKFYCCKVWLLLH